MKFAIADTHFGHNKEFIYKTRGFSSIEEHDGVIKEYWNSIVGEKDEVYHIGDLSFYRDHYKTKELLESLNGKKYLIRGGHDHSNMLKVCESCFEWIKERHTLDYNGYLYVMSHYPFDTWDRSHYGSFHLHGHLHNGVCGCERPRRFNVGCDVTLCRPVSIDSITEVALEMERRQDMVPISGVSPKYVERLVNYFDGLPSEAEISWCDAHGFSIAWTEKGRGFGEYVFFKDEQGVWKIDNEADSRESVKKAMCRLIDSLEITDK